MKPRLQLLAKSLAPPPYESEPQVGAVFDSRCITARQRAMGTSNFGLRTLSVMNVCAPFIRRPVGTSLLAIGLFMAGVVAYHFMPVAAIPRVDFPMISVFASLPGADPATVASSLAAPLERRLAQIAGVTEITSVSTLGGCSITVQFDLNRNVDGAARDVQAAINAAAGDLPINLPNPPTYHKINPADAPIMILAMRSDILAPVQVFEYGDSIIGQRLSQVEGVSQAFISGADKSAVRVQVNPGALASTGMSLEDVRSLLSQVNVDSPKGSLEGNRLSYTLVSNDQLLEGKGYQNLILTQRSNAPIRLSALGRAFDGTENARVAGWYNTNRAVLVIIFKQADANVIETVDRIRAVLPHSKKPPSVKLEEVSDRTTTIRTSVHEVQFSLLLSIALVVMVIFLFLRRFWPTFIASITVPLALAGTFAFMYSCHFSIDNLSLMAVTICVGFVVDDAIVVIENIHRFIEQGDPPMQAAFKGARQIGFTVISMSTSLVAVFIPLLFMGGLIGRLFHEFAVTVTLAIFVSGVISLTLTPMLCSRFLKPESAYRKAGVFIRACEQSFNWLLGHYETGLRWVLRHYVFTLGLWFLTLVATVVLYPGRAERLLPAAGHRHHFRHHRCRSGYLLHGNEGIAAEGCPDVLDDPAVATMASFIGGGMGSSTVNNGRMFVTLKPRAERKVSADQVIARLRKKLGEVIGINLFLQASQDIRVGGRLSRAQFQHTRCNRATWLNSIAGRASWWTSCAARPT